MSGTVGFQKLVNTSLAPGIAGGFASVNPRYAYLAGPGGLVAGAAGLAVGAFAWAVPPVDSDGTPAVVNNFGTGAVAGFVAREQQGLIVLYLAPSTLLQVPGSNATVFTGGDFWAINSGATQAVPGQKAYANYANGLVTFAATASPATVATSTSSAITAGTASVTGSIGGPNGGMLTVTAVASGTLVPGGILSGTGVASGTQITSQASGTPGGIGVYYVTPVEQSVASTTISETYGLLTVGGTLTGTFEVGSVLTGSGGATVTAGSVIAGLGTGTGGAGTYYVNPTQSSGSGTINATGNIETKWIAMSSGLPGEVVKISNQPLG